MNTPARGLSLEIVWRDGRLVEVRVQANNGRLAGEVDLYATVEEFGALAGALRGFPAGPEDRRAFQFGTFHEPGAGGGLRIVLRSGVEGETPLVDVELMGGLTTESGRGEMVRLRFPVDGLEAARFVGGLEAMRGDVGERARLLEAAPVERSGSL